MAIKNKQGACVILALPVNEDDFHFTQGKPYGLQTFNRKKSQFCIENDAGDLKIFSVADVRWRDATGGELDEWFRLNCDSCDDGDRLK